MNPSKPGRSERVDEVARRPYEAPAVIFETMISTRAGSPLSIGDDPTYEGVDPADLFGD